VSCIFLSLRCITQQGSDQRTFASVPKTIAAKEVKNRREDARSWSHCSLLSVLLGADIAIVTALALAAVRGLHWETGIALTANHLLALVSGGESSERWLNLDDTDTTTTKSEDQVEGGLLLDVVVGQGSSILELLSSEDESLLIGRNTFLVLDLGLDVLDGVGWLNVEGDGLSGQGLDEDLHTTSESKHKMEGRLLLDVIIGEGAAVFELLSSEDKSLLIGRDAFLVLDLGLDILNGIRWLDIEGDGFTSESLNEDLHTTSESEDEMEGRFLLDVVVGESSSILELLSSEDKSLLIGWNSFLVLDLGLDVLNGVGWLDIKGDSLSSESLDEDLHTTSESEDEMESGFLLDVVVGEGTSILELLTGEDKSLLVGWDTFLVLDLGLDVLDGVRWLNIKGDSFTGEGLHENLHLF